MGHKQYSIYEAKAKLSEIIRIVKRRRRVIITERGHPVVEVIPYQARDTQPIEARIENLAAVGAVLPSREPFTMRPVQILPGASARFLAEDRD